MEDIDEVRRKNLRSEAVRLGGDAELARAIGKDKNQIYQWIRTDDPVQQRTMRKTMARAIEAKLGRPIGWLDQSHSLAVNEQPSTYALSPEFPAARAKNDMRAVRYALQSLFAVLHETQQEIAEAVAKDIVETAGQRFARQGFLSTLVGTLRGVQGTSEVALEETPQVQDAPASKRAVSAAKRS
jgi:hypothetical protein